MSVPGQGRRRAGRGALAVVTALLIGSAIVRLGDDVGQALARAPDDSGMENRAGPQRVCDTPADLRGLMTALDQRESRIEAREATLEDRMQALEVADRAVQQRLTELQRAEASLRETIALAESASENDLDRLTKVYESMKPQQAAALFEQMDPEFAAGFLGRMRPDAAAEIMAGLSAEAAHLFSVVLAGRNAQVPRE